MSSSSPAHSPHTPPSPNSPSATISFQELSIIQYGLSPQGNFTVYTIEVIAHVKVNGEEGRGKEGGRGRRMEERTERRMERRLGRSDISKSYI
jgi:hypothetical protein